MDADRHFEIAIDEAVPKLDLQGMQTPAVANRSQRARLHRLTLDARRNWLDGMIGGP